MTNKTYEISFSKNIDLPTNNYHQSQNIMYLCVHIRYLSFIFADIIHMTCDMGWSPIVLDQWKSVFNHWNRCSHYQDNRINKRIFTWCLNKGGHNCKNWTFLITQKLLSCGLQNYLQAPFSHNQLQIDLTNVIMNEHVTQWYDDISRVSGLSGTGRNKLRSYNLLKDTYQVEQYCKLHMSYPHSSAFAKFRCGVAPLRLETGRYENLPEEERLCPLCKSNIENEMHVLFECSMYEVERAVLFSKAVKVNSNFETLSLIEKFKFVFTHPEMIRITAKTCCNILKLRNNILYSKNVSL